jgi:hypothetical protein
MSLNFGALPQQGEIVTGAKTLSKSDDRKTFYLTAAAGAAITLPAPYLGAEFSFVVGSAFATTDWTIVTNGSANIINGSVEVAGAVVVGGSEDTISFVATAETIGDHVRVRSNGTVWAVDGQAALSGGITLTQAS